MDILAEHIEDIVLVLLKDRYPSLGRALCKAVFEDLTLGGEIPSTKGVL